MFAHVKITSQYFGNRWRQTNDGKLSVCNKRVSEPSSRPRRSETPTAESNKCHNIPNLSGGSEKLRRSFTNITFQETLKPTNTHQKKWVNPKVKTLRRKQRKVVSCNTVAGGMEGSKHRRNQRTSPQPKSPALRRATSSQQDSAVHLH